MTDHACGSFRTARRALVAGAAGLAIGAAAAGWASHGTSPGTSPAEPADAPTARGGFSVIAKTAPPPPAPSERRDADATARPQSRGIRVASLDTDVDTDPAPAMSFAERFAGELVARVADAAEGPAPEPHGDDMRLALADPDGPVMPRPAAPSPPVRVPASASPFAAPPASPLEKKPRTASAPADAGALAYAPPDEPADRPLSATDSRTAIYDIAAHTVYLPDGRKLEAHSGRGSFMDDPRAVNLKMRGPTPPNVYALTLRERPFHGVRALRLNPVDEGKMFGRDGILAHTYMLGPKGASNGCVSFSNYTAFLEAYLRGDVKRMVVVQHLATPPDAKTASGWLPEKLKDLFRRS